MRILFSIFNSAVLLLFSFFVATASDLPDWEGGRPDGCTTITVGKNASDGGWVSTSHTCDSHRTRSWFDVQPARVHKKGDSLDFFTQQAQIYNPEFLLEDDFKHLGKKPFRTYVGFKYNNGYSDHLPIYIDLIKRD